MSLITSTDSVFSHRTACGIVTAMTGGPFFIIDEKD